MASNHWLKLWHETLHDPKIGRLPDRLYRRFIECLLAAGEGATERGDLPDAADLAWTLHTEEHELRAELGELARLGLLSADEDGVYFVTKFANRQAAMDDAERKRRSRDGAKRGAYYQPVTERDALAVAPVTIRDTDSDSEEDSDSDSDTDSEQEEEGDLARAGAPQPLAEGSPPSSCQLTGQEAEVYALVRRTFDARNVNAETPAVIRDLIVKYGGEWVLDAIKEMDVAGPKNRGWGYVSGILENWQRDKDREAASTPPPTESPPGNGHAPVLKPWKAVPGNRLSQVEATP